MSLKFVRVQRRDVEPVLVASRASAKFALDRLWFASSFALGYDENLKTIMRVLYHTDASPGPTTSLSSDVVDHHPRLGFSRNDASV
ncbi:MAG: hypothetical protein ACRD4I_04960 [Candidatus Angelobacter sp.]